MYTTSSQIAGLKCNKVHSHLIQRENDDNPFYTDNPLKRSLEIR